MRIFSAFVAAAVVLGLSMPGEAKNPPRCDRMDTVYGEAGEWVLALSWAPGYCKTSSRGGAECRTPPAALVLHGLWPQGPGKLFCSSPEQNRAAACKQRDRLDPLPLDTGVRDHLKRVMPGELSGLDRYEWVKHGSCSGMDANAYFGTAATLVDGVNASSFGRGLAGLAGQSVSARKLCGLFAGAYGNAAAIKFESKGDVLTGVTVNLHPAAPGKVTLDAADIAAVPQSSCADGNDTTYFVAGSR